MSYTTWLNYITHHPIIDADLWNALSVLKTELEIVYVATGVHYTYTPFFGTGITTVAGALNKIGSYLAGGGGGSGETPGLLTGYDDDDPLYDGYMYMIWPMLTGGTLKLGDFWVTVPPTGGDCTLGLYLNGVLKTTITIPVGNNSPAALTDCSAITYIARDAIDLKMITANSAGVLVVAIQL